jgi:hypothetical protein
VSGVHLTLTGTTKVWTKTTVTTLKSAIVKAKLRRHTMQTASHSCDCTGRGAIAPKGENLLLTLNRIQECQEPQLHTSVGGGSSGTGHPFTLTNCVFPHHLSSTRIQNGNKRKINESKSSMHPHILGPLMEFWVFLQGEEASGQWSSYVFLGNVLFAYQMSSVMLLH